MADDKPLTIDDNALDDAQGGATIELVDATIAGMRTEQMPRSGYQDGNDLILRRHGLADYDESGPGIVHRTTGKT